MRNPKLFHDRLARRLAALFGATSLTLAYAAGSEACGKKHPTTTTTSTTTGAGGADSGSPFTTANGFDGLPLDADPLETQCFTWPQPDGGMGGMGATSGSATSGSSTSGTTSGSSTAATTSAATTSAGTGDMDAGLMIDPVTGCPSDKGSVLTLLDPAHCPNGWEARDLFSGPSLNAQHQCCYQVGIHICLGGGRPYTAPEGAVTAPSQHGVTRGWSKGAPPDVAALSLEERAELAAAWTKDALLEHASVASFARFSMALLAVGAPSDLVEGAHRASLDEVRHAELCFALASGYAGHAVQPGAFPLGASLGIDASLVGLATSTVIEGCIGETVAAIRAAEQLARAEDPAVRHALATIAEDEARHAELAWKTVLWAIKQGGAPVRDAVREAFASVLRRDERTCATRSSTRLSAHGLMTDEEARSVSEAALYDLVEPAARTLLERTSPEATAAARPTA